MIKYTYRISRTALESWGRLTRNKIKVTRHSVHTGAGPPKDMGRPKKLALNMQEEYKSYILNIIHIINLNLLRYLF